MSEDVEPGDEVLADDPENAEKPKSYKVVARLENWTKRLIHIDVDQNGDGESDGHYRATGKHPFWTTERGWQYAVDLQTGDELLTDNLEKVQVIKVEEEKIVVDTYNLSVAGVHTFYVVDDGVAVLVHNATIHGGPGLPFEEPFPTGIRDRGPCLGAQQGRQFRIDQLELFEFDPNQPKHVRGWLRNERRRAAQGKPGGTKTPPGYELGHGRTTPAREGFDYSNSTIQGEDLNDLEESVRRRKPDCP